MANVGGSSSGAARVPKAPERREGRWGPSQLVETDFEAFYTEYHFPRETRFRLPSANETPYTDGIVPNAWRVLMGCAVMWPMYLGLECQLSLKEFLWFYTPIRSTQVDRFWYFRPRNQGVSPITSYPDTNKGWHDRYFFMSGVGWERFPGEDRQSESSLCWAFGSVPDQYRRDIKGLTSSEQAHVDAILEVGSIDWNALVCRENEGWLGYTVSEPSPRANPSPRSERSPRGRFPREDSRKESSRVSVGGLEDVSPMLSPTSGVRTEIPVPAVKVIREIETPSFSISLTVPPVKLRKLEGDLESQRKLVEELRTVARGTHLQMQTYEARVMDLERDIASRDTEVAELRQTVDGLEQGRVDFELSLSREKAELLQRLSDSRASSSKREEALRTELVGLRRTMREAADSFAAEKRSLEEARTGLTLRVAELSAVPAFPGDPVVLARRCIGVAMAVLEVAYLREGSRFQVRKEGRGKEIYERLVETLGTRGIHLPPGGDETL
ncbi:hypothetical protein CJ030_MR3G001290 [Morella rubra]|uniref:Uncharacterized protein n=2 Tax=Morella rubra TaxID=262757 RepID=A0A6A1W553_9ROSI|nr:hypothetical protein CJ030_MR3G001290 [Morella rubra]